MPILEDLDLAGNDARLPRRRSPPGVRWRWRPRPCRQTPPSCPLAAARPWPPCPRPRPPCDCRADIGATRVFLPVGVDRDHDLAGILKVPHLVGDARRLGFQNRDRHALNVGKAQDIFDLLDLLRRLGIRPPHLDLGTKLLCSVVHPFLDGIPPVGAAIGDEHQPRTRAARRACRAADAAAVAAPPGAAGVLPPQPVSAKMVKISSSTRTGRFSNESRARLPRLFFRKPNDVAYHNR